MSFQETGSNHFCEARLGSSELGSFFVFSITIHQRPHMEGCAPNLQGWLPKHRLEPWGGRSSLHAGALTLSLKAPDPSSLATHALALSFSPVPPRALKTWTHPHPACPWTGQIWGCR